MFIAINEKNFLHLLFQGVKDVKFFDKLYEKLLLKFRPFYAFYRMIKQENYTLLKIENQGTYNIIKKIRERNLRKLNCLRRLPLHKNPRNLYEKLKTAHSEVICLSDQYSPETEFRNLTKYYFFLTEFPKIPSLCLLKGKKNHHLIFTHFIDVHMNNELGRNKNQKNHLKRVSL